MGLGYAWRATFQHLVEFPESECEFYNRGMSGHKVFQLADRWDRDCFDLKPDVLSILIGVNDIWHSLNGKYDGTVKTYENDYRKLLERTQQESPKTKLVICEPFVLRCGAINDAWFPLFDEYRAVARSMAEAFGARFVPFQSMFDRASEIASPEHWAGDGVHPTPMGSSLMAHFWLKTVCG